MFVVAFRHVFDELTLPRQAGALPLAWYCDQASKVPMQPLHVITSCTKRKRYVPDSALLMRHTAGDTIADRFQRWRDSYQRFAAGVPALDLYAGDHWAQMRALTNSAETALDVELWVCSAGVGLVKAQAPVVPYAATFSRHHPDAVSRSADPVSFRRDVDEWWGKQVGWSGPHPPSPRTITDLVDIDPSTLILVVAAGEYLRVLRPDLLEAASRMTNADHLTIFSADAAAYEDLRPYSVPVSGDFATVLGGSLHSVNSRTAYHAISRLGGRAAVRSQFRGIVEELMETAQPRPTHNRAPMTDDEVIGFITERLARDPKARKTRLLRDLRDSNRACEQSRFGRLFDRVRSSRP